jgi:HSP90 family molecular chaperone
LDEYVARCTPEQNEIYYLTAPSKALAESSPYFETFKRKNLEVLFVYTALDEFVLTNLKSFNNRKIVSAESHEIKIDDSDLPAAGALSSEEVKDLSDWMKTTVPERLSDVKATRRLFDSPAIVTHHESGALRRMLRFVEQKQAQTLLWEVGPQHLEINVSHPIIVGLNKIRSTHPETAKLVLEQVLSVSGCVALQWLTRARWASLSLPHLSRSWTTPS